MTVTPNTPATVDASATGQVLVAEFTSSLACVLYLESTDLKARSITVGDPPTVNAEFAVATVASAGVQIAIAPVSSTTVLCVYKKSTGDTIARVLSVSGTTISGGTEKVLTTGALFGTLWLSQIPSTTKYIFAYDDSSDVRAMILTVTGTTVTEGSSVSVDNTEIPHSVRCVAFSATKGLVTWYGGLSTDNEGQVIDISGTTITTNTTKAISTTNTETNVNNATFLTFMSATKAIYGLSDQSTSDEYMVLTLSGSTFNIGTITTHTDGGFDHMHAARQSDTVFTSARANGGNNIEVEQFEITGASSDELTSLGTGNILVGSNDLFIWTAPVDSDTIIVHHEDTSSEVLTVSAPLSTTAFRFLGFDADDGTLMVSGLKDAGTLKLYDYDLDTLTEQGTASFGAATDSDLDNRTLGIFPVAKLGESDVWYLHGRDGSDVQVQYNDRNGTLGWTDIGPGTATWGTAKYAVGLMPEPTLSDDVIVTFSDDDVYRTRFGTMTWAKMGDAGGGLRASARQVSNRFNEILVAGTAAGTVEFSNNFGASFGDVAGTALGTINAIEVSL